MLTMERTFDQIVYEETATEIIEDLAKSLMESKPVDNTYSSVAGIDKAVAEVKFSESIRDLYKVHHSKTPAPSVHVQSYFRSQMDIMKVGKMDMSINQCAEMAIEILKHGGEKFYGILLSTTPGKSYTGEKMTFNPLHPITATELSSDKSPIDLNDPIWTLNVFAWKDEFDPRYSMPDAYNQENYITEIANIIAAMSNTSPFIVKNSDIKAAILDNTFVVNYQEKKYNISNGKEIKDKHGGKRDWIVPLQILNNGGIAYPYYGSSYTMAGIAWNLTPMMSANISRPTEGNVGFENGGRICTKSGDSKTIKGVSALNHSNLTSPLNADCFRAGSLTYAHQCMLAGLEILTGKSLTNSPSSEKPDTFKEYLENNPGSMAKDYLIYMREFVAQAHLEEPDPADAKEAALSTIDAAKEFERGQQYGEDTIVKYNNRFYKALRRTALTPGVGRISWEEVFEGEVGIVDTTTVVEPDPVYPRWEAGIIYQNGDIIDDRVSFDTPDQERLRQYTPEGWVDYIPPIDLTTIDTVVPGPAEPDTVVDPLPWGAHTRYRIGEQSTRRGWVYQVSATIADGTTQEEPTQNAAYWERVRPMQTTTLEEIA